jgi:hypothetical protein
MNGYDKHRRRRAERVMVEGKLVHLRAPHGRPTGYSNYGCRCGECTAAWTAKIQRRRSDRRALLEPDESGVMVTSAPVRHGLKATYDNWGCRCRPCTDAKTEYARSRYSAHRERVPS